MAAILARMQGTAVAPLDDPMPYDEPAPSPPRSNPTVGSAQSASASPPAEQLRLPSATRHTTTSSRVVYGPDDLEASPVIVKSVTAVGPGGQHLGTAAKRGDEDESDGETCECCEDLVEEGCTAMQCSVAGCVIGSTRGCIVLAAIIVACISPALVFLPVVVESQWLGAGRSAEQALLMGHNSFRAWKRSLTGLVLIGCIVLLAQGTVHGLVLGGVASGLSVSGDPTDVGQVGIQLSVGSEPSRWFTRGCSAEK